MTDAEIGRWESEGGAVAPEYEPCAHDKVYEPAILTTMPPQQRWVCRRCLARGTERLEACGNAGTEYYELVLEALRGRG
jgi:hypothetical protein